MVRAKLPITNNVLAAFATLMLLCTGSFPCNIPTWDVKKVEEQTWPAWKDFPPPLQLALMREQAVSADRPDTFDTAAAAQRYHDIDAACGYSKDAPGQPGSPDDLMAQLDIHFDNLALAVININSPLEQLAIVRTDQYAEIKTSLDALAKATPAPPAK